MLAVGVAFFGRPCRRGMVVTFSSICGLWGVGAGGGAMLLLMMLSKWVESV